MKHVPKKWGEEIWIVNNDEYCAKLLKVKKGATCSYHYHPKKKETFYCLEGIVYLIIDKKWMEFAEGSNPRTILPTHAHSFRAIEDSILLEVSTHHEDDDCVRLVESEGG